MTSEDEPGLSEDEMDEIVNRVVERLGQAGVGATDEADDEEDEIEVRSGDGTGTDAEESVDAGDEASGGGGAASQPDEAAGDGAHGHEDGAHGHEGLHEQVHRRMSEADRHREDAHERKRAARRRAQEAREAARGMEDLGDRIEAAVEAQLSHLGEHLEHALDPGLAGLPEPTVPGVVIGPDDTHEKAVYKTQLQKGGRVAVPDTEIEALDLEPGDALQVVLYPVG